MTIWSVFQNPVINDSHVHCMSMHGIVFCSVFDTHATHMFHACHIELVVNLYSIRRYCTYTFTESVCFYVP